MNDTEELRFGCFRLLPERRELWRHSEPLQLGSRSFDLLLALLKRQGRIATKDELMAEIWPGTVVEENNLAAQVSALRKVLGDHPREAQFLRTIPGRGYQFVAQIRHGNLAEATNNGAAASKDLSSKLSLVVLPFSNLSDDAEQAHFALGITETITTDLSRILGLLVIASATAAVFKDKTVDIRQICRELGVRFALTGSVQRNQRTVRINAQMVDADNALQLWSERFDGDSSDLFGLQDQITGRIANSMGREFNVVAALDAEKRKAAPSSTEFLLRGIALADKPVSLKNLQEQEHFFGKAVLLDQENSEAQARFSRAVLLQRIWFSASLPPLIQEDKLRQGAQAVERALALNPNNARAHLAMGLLHVVHGNFADAVVANETAIALDRNLALAHSNLGTCLVHCGRADQAIPAIERAIRLDPRGPQIAAFQCAMGIARLFLGEGEAAIHWYSLARASNRGLARAHAGLALALAFVGDTAAARRVAAELLQLAPNFRMSQTIHSPSAASPPKYGQFFDELLVPAAKSAGIPI